MPIPKAVARFNLVATNRVSRAFAGWMPWFGIVRHIGRSSGKHYRTPINIFRRGDRYVVALTYGSDVQWLRNVLAAGACVVEMNRTVVTLANPRVYRDPSRRDVSVVVRLALGLIRVDEFLELRPAEQG
jgi:deazaflavin-dependent oxidoreductase (nitroreductase family)